MRTLKEIGAAFDTLETGVPHPALEQAHRRQTEIAGKVQALREERQTAIAAREAAEQQVDDFLVTGQSTRTAEITVGKTKQEEQALTERLGALERAAHTIDLQVTQLQRERTQVYAAHLRELFSDLVEHMDRALAQAEAVDALLVRAHGAAQFSADAALQGGYALGIAAWRERWRARVGHLRAATAIADSR